MRVLGEGGDERGGGIEIGRRAELHRRVHVADWRAVRRDYSPTSGALQRGRIRTATNVALNPDAALRRHREQQVDDLPVADGEAIHHVDAGPLAQAAGLLLRLRVGALAQAPVDGQADLRLDRRGGDNCPAHAHLFLYRTDGIDIYRRLAKIGHRLQQAVEADAVVEVAAHVDPVAQFDELLCVGDRVAGRDQPLDVFHRQPEVDTQVVQGRCREGLVHLRRDHTVDGLDTVHDHMLRDGRRRVDAADSVEVDVAALIDVSD